VVRLRILRLFLQVKPQNVEAVMSQAERNKEIGQKSAAVSDKIVGPAIERAKAKNARLRLMKERNENYLAEQREERQGADELTGDLGASTGVEDSS
jgi:hypothetical protein